MAAEYEGGGSEPGALIRARYARSTRRGFVTHEADILIAAIGRAEFVNANMVKDGAAVIGVGINRVDHETGDGGTGQWVMSPSTRSPRKPVGLRLSRAASDP